MPTDPRAIAERGAQIYAAKYKQEYEKLHRGQYAAIDVKSEQAFVSLTPEAAINAAKAANPSSLIHLIKIGSPGVFRVGYSASGAKRGDWLFGQ
jgi:hypothetical protein